MAWLAGHGAGAVASWASGLVALLGGAMALLLARPARAAGAADSATASEWDRRLARATAHLTVFDLGGTYRAVRDTDLEGRHVERSEWVGATVEQVFGSQDYERQLRPRIERCLAGETAGLQAWLNPHRRGRRFLEIRYSPFREASGEVVGVVEEVRDLTAGKLGKDLEAATEPAASVVNAQKLESLGLLAGRLAHDFNNVLAAVLGNVHELRRELTEDSPSRRRLDTVEEAGKRAAELCRELLLIAGKTELQRKPIDLSELVKDAAKLLEMTTSKKVMVKYTLGRGLPQVDGDPSQLIQLLLSVVNNASDAVGDRTGSVSISTGRMHCDRGYLGGAWFAQRLDEGEYVFVEVADTGCGMDEATLARLFDPFFTTKESRRGLGLAAAAGIVRAHGGGIRVGSKPGRGTTLRVLLPRSVAATDQAVARPEDEPAADTNWRGSGIVLVVDDEEPVRELAAGILARAGFEVLEAGDGSEALELFRNRPDEIDAVLLDLTMPRTGGVEALRELRRIRGDVRVLLSSGYDEQQVTEELGDEPVAPFIQKPYQPQRLLLGMRDLLEPER